MGEAKKDCLGGLSILEVKIDNKTKLIQLIIGFLSSLILMCIVGIQLHMFPDWEETPDIYRGVTPLSILALIEVLSAVV